jgi:hypothetical protein
MSEITKIYASQEYVNSKITTSVANKVDKIEGKGLSSNDFTTAEKDKLAGAVLYTEQTLTEEQKTQARENIGATSISEFPIIATEPDESIYVLENTDIDTTLSVSGKVADAKAVGNAIANITITETDPTVPSWAKASSKPSYTKSEIGLGNVDNVKQYSASNPPPYPVTKVNGKTGAVTLDAAAVGAVSTSKTLTLTGIDTDGVSHTYTIYGIEQ